MGAHQNTKMQNAYIYKNQQTIPPTRGDFFKLEFQSVASLSYLLSYTGEVYVEKLVSLASGKVVWR